MALGGGGGGGGGFAGPGQINNSHTGGAGGPGIILWCGKSRRDQGD